MKKKIEVFCSNCSKPFMIERERWGNNPDLSNVFCSEGCVEEAYDRQLSAMRWMPATISLLV